MYKSKEIVITHLKNNNDYENQSITTKSVATDKTLADMYQEFNNYKNICADVSIKVIDSKTQNELQVEKLTSFNEIMSVMATNIKTYEKTTMQTKSKLEAEINDKTQYENIKEYIFLKVSI